MGPTLFIKINLKWIIDLNIKYKAIKHLEDNIGKNIDDLVYGDEFSDITPKTQSIKEITDQLDNIKIKIFCYMKDQVKRMRRQATNQKIISAKDTSDKELLSKIYKELNNKKTNKPI